MNDMLHRLVTSLEPLLVLVPHPDDELIGCGALLLRRRMAGVRTTMLFLTTGEPQEEREARPRYPIRRAMRRACAEQVAEHLDCSTTFLDGHCRRLHHGWIHVLAAVVDHLERHSGGILFPACEAGHPDHDVAWALGRRAACEVQSRNAWEYSLYGWNGQDVRFLNGMRRMPDEEVLVLDRVEALAKDRLLQCYGQEYPRILHRCPLAGETFKPSRVDTEVGPDSRPEPGWTSRIKQPNPREVEKAVALILALDQPEEAVLNA